MAAAPLGVSVILCTHNGALRLPPTLEHLAAQRVRPQRPWEVVVVDNASTDCTREVVQRVWPKTPPAPLRLVSEPTLGLTYARRRGIAEARYPLLAFVDDDNWLAPDWVETAATVMEGHPAAGALGGRSEGVFEGPVPAWLDGVEHLLAIGPRNVRAGDVSDDPGLLWGAGLVLRRAALSALARVGFHPSLVGRTGSSLSSGEDTELCLALRLAGWRLWYEPSLRLEHYIPAARLSWPYVRRLHQANGTASVHHDPYYFALRRGVRDPLARLRWRWWWQALAAAKALAREPPALLRHTIGAAEGDLRDLRLQTLLARLVALVRLRGAYDAAVARVLAIPWSDAGPPSAFRSPASRTVRSRWWRPSC